MSESQRAATFVSHFYYTLQNFKFTWYFIRQHHLWKGLFAHRWINYLVFIAAGLLSYQFISLGVKALKAVFSTDQSMSVSLAAVSEEGYQFLFTGGYKYLVLLLFQVVVFHFVVGTKEILTGQRLDRSWKTFKSGFIRSLQIFLRYYLYETVLIFIVGLAFSMLGLELIKPVAGFLIQCYFIGFAVLDNYHEGFNLNIVESEKRTRSYAGVAVALGLVYYILVAIPILGLTAPIFASVNAIITMFWLERPDEHQLTV